MTGGRRLDGAAETGDLNGQVRVLSGTAQLAFAIAAPDPQRAVASDRHAVFAPGGDSHDAGQTGYRLR